MNQNSARVQRVGRTALIIVRLVQAVLILSIVIPIFTWFFPMGSVPLDRQEIHFYTILLNSVTSAAILAVLFIASGLLKEIQSNSTPFTRENANRLKKIAVLLVAVEPVQMLCGMVFNALRPLTSGGQKVVEVRSMGGMIIVLGLIMFCIALVFEYGTDLQKQSDETL